MPDFTCATCGSSFSIPDKTLAQYPGWTPRYCRRCKPGSSGTRARGRGARSAGGARAASSTKEENLPLDVVLARYSGGPQSGVFTDGACAPNPGPGGWGVVWVEEGAVKEQRHGHDGATTNNRMELTAIIEALEMLPDDAAVTLYSDSKLCIQTLDEWAAGWEKRGWRRSTGPIKNLDLVKRAWALRQARPRVKLRHIRAHSGERWNEYADSLATAWTRDTL